MSEPDAAEPAARAHPGLLLSLVALGTVLVWRGVPQWWLGAALLCAAAAMFLAGYRPLIRRGLSALQQPRRFAGRQWTPARVLPDLLCVAVVITVATVMMSDVFFGERPVSFDHTVHYFKAHQLRTRMLPEGRLFGWSHRWFAGYPANYLYPIGADLWVSVVHLLGFGALSMSRAYGLAFWLMHVFTGVAGYRFGRVLGGPAVGLVTGLLLLTDLSAFRHGGWAYTVVYGVWPQALGLAFALLALCQLPRLFSGRGTAAVGAFGLWMGLAIISHPMVLVFMAVLLLASALAAVFADEVRAATGVARLVAGYVLAGVVSAAWLLPFLSTRKLTTPMGVWWDSTYEMGRGLWQLSLLPGSIGYVVAFGCAAVLLALRARRFVELCAAFMCLLVPVLFSSTFVDELGLPALHSAFAKIQYLRISTMVKPCWFALCGCFVVALLRRGGAMWRSTATSGRGARSPLQVGVYAGLVGLLTLPILVPAAQLAYTDHVRKSLRTVHDRQFQSDREQLTRWLREHLPRDRFYRVGIFTAHNHDLVDLAADLDFPMYKRGFTPCANFVYKMRTREDAVLQAVNVRFAIAKKSLPEDAFEQIARFGIYRVFRYRHYRAEPFEVVQGQGDVRLLRFDDEHIALDVADGASGTLRLSVSWFPRWRAYRDGEPVPISRMSLPEEPETTAFMTVPLAPGHYEFVFERSLLDALSPVVGMLGVLVAVLLMWLERRPIGAVTRALSRLHRALDAMSGPAFARARMWLLSGFGGVLFVVAVGLAEWRPVLELDGALSRLRVERVRFDFLEQLSRARVWYAYRDRPRACRRIGERFVCPDREGQFDSARYVASSPATIEEYRMVRCVRARPESHGPLRIDFRDVPRGDALIGYYGVEFEGRLLFRKRPVSFTVDIDGERRFDAPTEEDNRMHYFRIDLQRDRGDMDVRFGISAVNVHKRWLCFHAQVVDLE